MKIKIWTVYCHSLFLAASSHIVVPSQVHTLLLFWNNPDDRAIMPHMIAPPLTAAECITTERPMISHTYTHCKYVVAI